MVIFTDHAFVVDGHPTFATLCNALVVLKKILRRTHVAVELAYLAVVGVHLHVALFTVSKALRMKLVEVE